MALGSFIVAVLEFFRSIMVYVENKCKQLTEDNETAGAKAVRGHVEAANPLQRDEKDNDDDQALGAQAGKRRAPRVS